MNLNESISSLFINLYSYIANIKNRKFNIPSNTILYVLPEDGEQLSAKF